MPRGRRGARPAGGRAAGPAGVTALRGLRSSCSGVAAPSLAAAGPPRSSPGGPRELRAGGGDTGACPASRRRCESPAGGSRFRGRSVGALRCMGRLSPGRELRAAPGTAATAVFGCRRVRTELSGDTAEPLHFTRSRTSWRVRESLSVSRVSQRQRL